MGKEIKEVPWHLYMDCNCKVTTTEYGVQGPPKSFMGSIHGVYYDRWTTDAMELSIQVMTEHGGRWAYKPDQVQLVLRPLSDLTEEEKIDLYKIVRMPCPPFIEPDYDDPKVKKEMVMWAEMLVSPAFGLNLKPDQFIYLLSRHCDLFGLIDSGQAIDLSTLEGKDIIS
jgi:hypothetical protein